MIHRIARAHLWIAAVLAAITIGTALIWSTRVAAGYGYVSQADLWVQGNLHVDQGDPAWLDRMVEWLAAHGHHPCFVLEPQEVAALRARDGPTNMSARLDWTPMVSLRGGAVTMYDGVRRERGGAPATTRYCPPRQPSGSVRLQPDRWRRPR